MEDYGGTGANCRPIKNIFSWYTQMLVQIRIGKPIIHVLEVPFSFWGFAFSTAGLQLPTFNQDFGLMYSLEANENKYLQS